MRGAGANTGGTGGVSTAGTAAITTGGTGAAATTPPGTCPAAFFSDARAAAGHGVAALEAFKADLPEHNIRALDEIAGELDRLACNADAADDGFPGDTPATGRAA